MTLEPRGAPNGTLVDGLRIAGPNPLHPGQSATFGSCTIVISPTGAAICCSIEVMRALEVHGRSRPDDALRVRIGMAATEQSPDGGSTMDLLGDEDHLTRVQFTVLRGGVGVTRDGVEVAIGKPRRSVCSPRLLAANGAPGSADECLDDLTR